MGRRLALLIATYEYEDVGLRRLTAPAHDAEALAQVLRDPRVAGFEVTALVNEPHHRVGEAIGDFYRDRRSDDLTLLYFTGHGLKDDEGRLYLAMRNTRRDSLLFTGIAAEQIDRAMEGCASRQKVLILDCCYSGAFPAAGAKGENAVHTLERFQGRGRTVLTASDSTQYSFEGNQPHGEAAQSVFTRYLVAGLRDGSADLDRDGDITLDELYSFVHDRVVEEMPHQRPKKQDNVQGRTVIAQNVNWALPAYVQNAIRSPIATERLSALDGLDHLYRIGNEKVRATVREQFAALREDDSRLVSSAAAARLEPLSEPSNPELRTTKAPTEQANSSPVLPSSPIQPPPPQASAPALPSSLDQPPPPKASAAPDETAETAAPAAAFAPETAAPAVPPRRPWVWPRPPAHAVHRLRKLARGAASAGTPALVAATLLAFVFAHRTYAFRKVPRDLELLQRLPWAALITAVVALAGAVLAFRARARPDALAPGVLLGAAAAGVCGLVFLAPPLAEIPTEVDPWLEFAGYLALVVAGAVTAWTLRRGALFHAPGRPGDRFGWALIGLGLLTTAALTFQVQEVARQLVWYPDDRGLIGEAAATVTATALAIGIPLGVVTTVTRRLGLGVLLGWAGGLIGLALAFPLRSREVDSYLPRWLLIAAALLLAAGAVVRARREPVKTPEAALNRRRRSGLVAVLLLAPVLAVGQALGSAGYAQNHVAGEHLTMGLALSPDGSRLYVLDVIRPPGPRRLQLVMPGELTVLDAGTGRALSDPIDIGNNPAGLAVSRDGATVYVAQGDPAKVSVISALENAIVDAPIALVGKPFGIDVSIDGRRAYVPTRNALTIIDTSTNRVISTPVPLGADSGSSVVSPDGSRIYVGHPDEGRVSVLDSHTGQEAGEPITVGGKPGQLVVTADGKRLLVVSASADDKTYTLLAFDLDKGGTATGQVRLTDLPTEVALSPDGRRAYIASLFSGVSVIDTRLMATVGTMTAIDEGPLRVTVSPDGRRVYVATVESGVLVLRASDPSKVSPLKAE